MDQALPAKPDDFTLLRQIHTVLVMHFIENMKQAEIAERLNLSASKVNRLIALGRRQGMVRIEIQSPFQRLVELERLLCEKAGLGSAVVTPSTPGSATATLQEVGRAAASELVEKLRDGDVIAITGGKAVSAVVEAISVERRFDVTVVPLTGGVQGKYYTDVNHLASRMAERLGGTPMMLHAPLFAESREQRDMLKSVASIRDVLDLARAANVAIVGVGSIEPEGSSYYDLHPVPEADRKMLTGTGVAGEFLGHLIMQDGTLSNYALNARLVAVEPKEISDCRRVIGVASGAHKVGPIRAALRGGYLNALIGDEETVRAVLRLKEERIDVVA
jgi:DNA-binding transcriptional regulator LsrR (DeoR family)